MTPEVLRREGFVLENPMKRPASTTAFTITYVAKEDPAAESSVLECYAEYEDLPADHPLSQRYEKHMQAWLRGEKAKPPQPIRLHWYFVVEEGVSSEQVQRAWFDAEDALSDGREGADTEQLLRNYLRKKHGSQTG